MTELADISQYGYYYQAKLPSTANIPNLNKIMIIVLNTMACNTLNLKLMSAKGDVDG